MVAKELLFFFSALGAFNGLLLSFYVFFAAKEEHFSNKFLGFLLLVLSVRIGKSVFMFFSEDLSHYFIQLGLIACALIGPFLYLYIKSIETPVKREWSLHVFPWIVILLIVSYIYPYNVHYERWWHVVIPVINYQWLVYILLAAYHLRTPLINLFKRNRSLDQQASWLMNVFLGNVIIWIAYKTFFFGSYIVGALSFSFILYLLVLMIVFRKKNARAEQKERYANKKIETEEATELISKLDLLIREGSLYRNPKLKLADLASQLEILPHTLSQILNDNFNKNFSQYINEFRIEAAKEMIHEAEHLSLEGVGKECGFNSNSTFYATFKKLTGTTPARFKSS